MSWNGSGVFNRLYSWVADKAAAIDITASRMDADTNDITSNGFGNCLTRDGQGQPTANLPMAGFRHTGVQNAVNRSDYAALAQLQDGIAINWAVAAGSADAITATYAPALTALVDGQLCRFRASAANATTTPTFAPNGLTAHTITKGGGAALVPGDIPAALAECVLRYNLADTRWELLEPAFGLQSRTTVNDAAYTAKTTDRLIAYTAITVARAVALPAAAAFPTGTQLTVVDESGSATLVVTITLNRNGADTINGATSAVIAAAYGFLTIESNGSAAWTIVGRDFNSQFSSLPTSLPASAWLLCNNGGVVSIS